MKLKLITTASIFFMTLMLFHANRIAGMVSGQDEVINERRITVSEYRDKMMGGWIGQMVGVGWGAPTEFRFMNTMIPEDEVPEWSPEMVNVWGQDDLYVEMTFLRSLEEYGLDVSIRQAGLDFAYSKYELWHANVAGRSNLRKGIAPPDCSHPEYNAHADDIDYQIEADFSGLISPGLPNTVIALGEKFGRLMNYGDGVYAGQFVGGMYAEAFFENDPLKIIKAGLACIPAESQYAEMVGDVIRWHNENPDDWQAAWQNINAKYHDNPDYRRWSCSGPDSDFNIDAKINGAYIIMGMLYGNQNIDQTIIISMQCGQDSDCNPSNAGGILATSMGYESLPEEYISGLEKDEKFSYTNYDFPSLIDVCLKLAREQVVAAGGRVEKNEAGEEVFVIPVLKPEPSELTKSWEPGPVAGSRFTSEELPNLTWTVVSQVAFWLLFVVALIALPENRNIKAFIILIPIVSVFVLWELVLLLIPDNYFSFLEINQTLFLSQAIGFSIMFLLGNRIGKYKGFVTALIALIIFSAIGILGTFSSDDNYFSGWTDVFVFKYFFAAVILILSLFLASKISRKKYGNLRFLLLILLFLIVSQLLVVIVLTTLSIGLTLLMRYFIYILLISIIPSILFFLVSLPFWILAFSSKEYNIRFRKCLKLPERNMNE